MLVGCLVVLISELQYRYVRYTNSDSLESLVHPKYSALSAFLWLALRYVSPTMGLAFSVMESSFNFGTWFMLGLPCFILGSLGVISPEVNNRFLMLNRVSRTASRFSILTLTCFRVACLYDTLLRVVGMHARGGFVLSHHAVLAVIERSPMFFHNYLLLHTQLEMIILFTF